jgi:hypothetical protein
MWNHPGVFALGWRDVIAAWIVCFTVAAALFGGCVFDSEGGVEFRSAATRAVIAVTPRGTPVAENRAARRSG